jgi:hypothetical protein
MLRGMNELEVGTEKSNISAYKFYKNLVFSHEYILLSNLFNP